MAVNGDRGILRSEKDDDGQIEGDLSTLWCIGFEQK